MDNDTIKKFVENMRASGQPDDMIADSLISAGHNELMVFNALGVSDLEELEEKLAEQRPEHSLADIPSAFSVVDENGDPVVFDGGGTAPVQANPTPPTTQPVRPPVDRSKPPRPRSYPRPPRRPAPRPTSPYDEGFAKQTDDITPPATPKPHLPDPATLPDPRTEPKTPTFVPKSKKPKLAPLKPAKKKRYGHHTFDDFMGRIDAHKELPASTDHTLEPGYENEPIDVKPLAPARPTHKQPVHTEKQAESIDDLLAVQKEEAAAGPGGPDIDDLLDKKDIEELSKEAESTAPMPKVDPNTIPVPEAPQAQKTAHAVQEVKDSVLLKVVVILLGVLVLVGLAASIVTRIAG